MTRLLIKNGRLVDPAQNLDGLANLLLVDGKVARIDVAPADPPAEDAAIVIDAQDRVVTPGWIDMHVQLREPGFEEDETIATGTAAALAGGITTIACLPNTDPPVDSQASVEFIQLQAARSNNCRVLVVACVSKDRAGEQLAELGSLAQAGAVAFSDAAAPIHNPELMRRALEYAQMFRRPVLNHPETLELTHGGTMHEGLVSTILGLGGLPAEAEDVMTSRDLRLAEATGGQLHLTTISTSGSVDIVRRAKARGIPVTCGVAIANLVATDEMLRSFDSNCKLNPPLRSRDHIESCLAGLESGVIDVIVSGHAPCAAEKKMLEIDQAPFGMVGLETLLGMVVTCLIEPGHLSWSQVVEKISRQPARILRQPDLGHLQIGAAADVTIIDPRRDWQIDPAQFVSKSSNTPFAGRRLRGAAEHTIVGGHLKWSAAGARAPAHHR